MKKSTPWEQGDYLKYEKWSYVFKTPYDSSDSDGNSLTVEVAPTGHVYGVWGEHGFGRIQAGVGRYRGIRKSDNLSFDGTFGFITPYVIGNAADEAPGGTGSATWKGPAEAVAVGTFAHQRGTASLTIEDLSDPELSVSIVIKGQEIGSSNWSSIALTGSRFDVGANEQDRLVGFFSPSHVESWGVFGTQTYLGIFGAKRKRTDSGQSGRGPILRTRGKRSRRDLRQRRNHRRVRCDSTRIKLMCGPCPQNRNGSIRSRFSILRFPGSNFYMGQL